jgi:AcrR family transcriptional regulator
MAPGLRERKKEKTRVALETAALRLFETNGYDATTVDQIADLADVSTRTFFRYYPTKADVLLNDQAARLAMVQDLLDGRPAGEPLMASLRALMAAIGSDLPAERHLLRAQYRWAGESDTLLASIRNHHARIVELVTRFVAARLDAPDPFDTRARAIATACVASLVAVTSEWVSVDGADHPDVDAAIATFESTIVVPG